MRFLIAAIAVVLAATAVVVFVTHEQASWRHVQVATGPAVTEGDVARAMRR